MSLLQKLFGRSGYDEAACIRILFDRSQPLSERGAAAESLFTGQTPTATEALLRFVLDETEEMVIREEAAATLGDIYNEIGVDHQALARIPEGLREEVLGNINPSKLAEQAGESDRDKSPN